MKAHSCGERACPRWGAKRPQNRPTCCIRHNRGYGFTAAAQPSAGKPARHIHIHIQIQIHIHIHIQIQIQIQTNIQIHIHIQSHIDNQLCNTR
ncbi:hypothetical protein HX866_31030 [Pseudomonas gingeri]|uniref:hypothetical protein n=1 Tax=Pseudomonas gingeri TaxID=117681 RepID=UPI0015A1CCE2|nr:hypothetical protein [Pseudomonas gingeri]NWA29327.1 hypothetical protein [Pseudomonas gingeri]